MSDDVDGEPTIPKKIQINSELNEAYPATQLSASLRAFTDFNVVGNPAVDNIQYALEQADAAVLEDKKREKEEDTHAYFQALAMQEIQEFQANYLDELYTISIGGVHYQFTDEDLEATISDIQNDPNAFADKYDLSETETMEAMELIALLESAQTPEERMHILQDWGEKSPVVAKAVVAEAQIKHDNLENTLSTKETLRNTKGMNDFLSDAPSGYSNKPTSKLADPFNMEVKKEPFNFDQTTEIKVTDKTPSVFVLD